MIALVPTAEDAARLAVAGGEPVEELHCTIAYYSDADLLPDPETVASVTGCATRSAGSRTDPARQCLTGRRGAETLFLNYHWRPPDSCRVTRPADT